MANQLPSADDAFARLFNDVYQNVLFHKLASYGIEPTSDAQRAAMIESAMRLRAMEEESAYKAAEDGSDPFVAANEYLAGLAGESPRVKQAAQEEAIGNMAAELMRHPDYYNSVLAIKAKQAADAAGR